MHAQDAQHGDSPDDETIEEIRAELLKQFLAKVELAFANGKALGRRNGDQSSASSDSGAPGGVKSIFPSARSFSVLNSRKADEKDETLLFLATRDSDAVFVQAIFEASRQCRRRLELHTANIVTDQLGLLGSKGGSLSSIVEDGTAINEVVKKPGTGFATVAATAGASITADALTLALVQKDRDVTELFIGHFLCGGFGTSLGSLCKRDIF